MVRPSYLLQVFVLVLLTVTAYGARYNAYPSTGNRLYDDFDDINFSSPTKPKEKKVRALKWQKIAVSSVQLMSYGSLAFVGFTFLNKYIQRQRGTLSPQSSSSSPIYVPISEETASKNSTAEAEMKNEISEIWNALLTMHNKQNELRDKMSSIHDKVEQLVATAAERAVQEDDAHYEEEIADLKRKLDNMRQTFQTLESSLNKPAEITDVHNFEAINRNVQALNSSMTELVSRINKVEKRSKELEETLLTRMKHFFQACKDMILNSMHASTEDSINDHHSTS